MSHTVSDASNQRPRAHTVGSTPAATSGPSIIINPQRQTGMNNHPSFYQDCLRLRRQLVHLPGFRRFLPEAQAYNVDVVTELWNCFEQGWPLCHLYDLISPKGASISVEDVPRTGDKTLHYLRLFVSAAHDLDCFEAKLTLSDFSTDRRHLDGFIKASPSS